MVASGVGGRLGADVLGLRLDVGRYFTRKVYGIKDGYTASAPGLVGWMYIVGGIPLVAVLSLILGVLFVWLWLVVSMHRGLRAGVFVQGSLLLFFLPYIGDGRFDTLTVSGLLRVCGFVALLLIGEYLTRTMVISPRTYEVVA